MEDLQKVEERVAGGGTGFRAGRSRKVCVGKLHYEGGGTDPL